MNRTGNTLTPVPPTRKNGAMATVTSPPRNSAAERKLTTFHVTFPWDSITPFGEPVVPEVWGSMNRSSIPMSSSIGSSGDSAMSVSNEIAGSDDPPTAIRCRTEGGTDAESIRCWMTMVGSVSSRTWRMPAATSR